MTTSSRHVFVFPPVGATKQILLLIRTYQSRRTVRCSISPAVSTLGGAFHHSRCCARSFSSLLLGRLWEALVVPNCFSSRFLAALLISFSSRPSTCCFSGYLYEPVFFSVSISSATFPSASVCSLGSLSISLSLSDTISLAHTLFSPFSFFFFFSLSLLLVLSLTPHTHTQPHTLFTLGLFPPLSLLRALSLSSNLSLPLKWASQSLCPTSPLSLGSSLLCKFLN